MQRTPLFLSFAYRIPILVTMVLCSNFLFGQLINNGEICGNGFDDNGVNGIDENCSRCNNKQDNIWYFGDHAGLDFNSGAPVLLTNGQTSVQGGSATVADANGQLLFYTDGIKIFNRTHTPFLLPSNNGNTNAATQPAVIVPHPNNPLQYFIVTTSTNTNNGLQLAGTMTFSAANPLGLLNVQNPVTLLPANKSTQKLVLARHANCKDYWVISHTFRPATGGGNTSGKEYYAYLVNSNGFNTQPVISPNQAGTIHQTVQGIPDVGGQLAISQQNNKIANALNRARKVDVSDFDANTGIISNTISINVPLLPGTTTSYLSGTNFSPDGRFLYVTINSFFGSGSSKMLRFDLTGSTPMQDVTLVGVNTAGIGQILPTPDGNHLVIAYPSSGIVILTNPNSTAVPAVPTFNFISLSNTSFGLSSTIPDFCTPSTTINISSGPYCAGVPITVTATPTNGVLPFTYSWNTGQSTPAITPTTSVGVNIYRVTVTDATGCSTTASTSINVAPPPNTTVAIIPSAPYCAGAPITVTATPTGGVSPYTYSWNTGQNSNPITTTIPIGVSPIYQVTVTDAAGCSATASTSPNVTPNITISKTVSNTNVTIGQIITYSITVCNFLPVAQTIQISDVLPNSLVPTNLNGFTFNPTTSTLSQSVTLAGTKGSPNCTTVSFSVKVIGALCGEPPMSIINTATATTVGGFCPAATISANAAITISGGSLTNLTIGSGVGIGTVSQAIIAGRLLPVVYAQNFQQRIIIEGTLIVDINYSFTNGSEIVMKQGAMIWINQGKSLFLTNSLVHGCTRMWKTINVQFQATLFALNSFIEDGEYAVTANDQSKILLINTIFTKNYVSLFVGRDPAKPIKDLFSTIQGCTFQGGIFQGDAFLPKYPGQQTNPNPNGWPFAGIQLHEVRNFNLISPTTPNIFQNMNAGILAADVNLNIRDAIFRDMHIGYPNVKLTPTTLAILNNNIGIYGQSSTGGHILSQRGFNSSTIHSFENCRFGLVSWRMSFEIADNNMNNIDIGIASIGAQNLKGAIYDNILDNCNSAGFWMLNNDPMKLLSIHDNTIRLTAGFGGIILDEFSNALPNTVFIERNVINLLDTRRGISLQNQFNGIVSENQITLANSTSFISFPNRTGIFSGGGRFQSLSCNVIRGGAVENAFDLTLLPTPFNNQNANNYGIEIDISPENTYTCNEMHDVLSAMRFTGNCNTSILEQNIFGPVSRGLEVLQSATTGTGTIGLQSHGQNRWTFNPITTTNPIYVGIAPFINDLDIVGARNTTNTPGSSLFTVDPIQDPEFLPFSFSPTTFFTNSPNSNPILPACSGFTCIGIQRPAGLDPFDQMVTLGTFQSPFFPQTAEFEANAITHHKLKKNPSLASVGSTAAAFVQAMDNRCEGDFYTVAEQAKGLYTIPTPLQNQIDVGEAQIKTGLDNIYRLDSLIAVDSTLQDSLLLLIENLALNLQPIMTQYQQNLVTAMQTRQQRANVAHNFNHTISAQKLAEKNLKEVNKIYLQTIAQNNIDFNPGQIQKLHQIALQCPAEGGAAVYKARAMVTFFTQLDYALLQTCLPSGHGNGNGNGNGNAARLNQNGTSISIYPNPANEYITLEWVLTDENTNNQFIIYNTLGQPVQELTLQGSSGQTNITISNLPVGFYLCKLYANGEVLDSQKLVIVR